MINFLIKFISVIYIILISNLIAGIFIIILAGVIGFVRDIIVIYEFSDFTLNLIKHSTIIGLVIFNIGAIGIIIKMLIDTKKIKK
jgi:hypothetical protein